MASEICWSHPSVTALCEGGDPIQEIVRRARSLALRATDSGWTGPPFDPIALARTMEPNVAVVPREDIADARICPLPDGGFEIEYNPNRPRGRMRFSIAHEVAHMLFEDCSDQVRARSREAEGRSDAWQLEMLCNVAASELLMPLGSFPDLGNESLGIDRMLELRREFDVSTEAVLLRAVKLTKTPCAMFAASRRPEDEEANEYLIDYCLGSKSWNDTLSPGSMVPSKSVVAECVAIGFTGKGREQWESLSSRCGVECVGIPPYPKHRYPRVVGLLVASRQRSSVSNEIRYLKGDATSPRGSGPRIIAHVVNDATLNWGGGGFAAAVRAKWPAVQEQFRIWGQANQARFRLGHMHPIDVSTDDLEEARVPGSLTVASMIAQHGYGKSKSARIRYEGLESCLAQLADLAFELQAPVHMPRIGCGLAGGEWQIISELVEDFLCRTGVEVTVYDLR